MPPPVISPVRWTVVEDILCTYTEPESPVPEQQWQELLDVITLGRVRGMLVGLASGGPGRLSNARMRGALRDIGALTVGLTDDRLTLGLIRTGALFGLRIGAYPWRQIERACGRLELSRDSALRVTKVMHALRAGDPIEGFH